MTKAESIAQEILTRLRALPLVPAANVSRNRPRPLAQAQSPWINFRLTSEEVTSNTDQLKVRDLTVMVTIYVRTADPEADADPIREQVHGTIMAGENLGGTASLIEEINAEWETGDADTDSCELHLSYRIKYHTFGISLN